MKYFQVLCFFLAFAVIKSRRVVNDNHPSSSTDENILTSISDRVKNLNENVTEDVHKIKNVSAESVVNIGQISPACKQNTCVENDQNTMQISSKDSPPLSSNPSEAINHVLTSSTRDTKRTVNLEDLDRNVAQQNYSVGEMQQVDPNVIDIFVIDSKSQEVAKKFTINRFDLNTTLDQVREKFKSQGLRVEDRFVKEVNGSFFRISNETYFTLNDVKNRNAVYVDFDSDSIKQYLKGLKKDANGQLAMTNHTVADFKRYPHIRTIKYSGFERGYTFDPKEMDMLKFGITDKSANYAKVLSYSATQQNTYRSGQATNHLPLIAYSIARYVVKKKDIKINEDDLIINSEFYDEIRSALLSSGLNLSKARKLLAVLQKYGWYVPLHYTTGGSFYVTNKETINNSQEAVDKSVNLLHCFQLVATRKSINDDVTSAPNCKQMSIAENFENYDRNMRISSSPASFIRHSSLVDMCEDSSRDPKQRKIVEYKRLLPILLLLQDYNNWILSQCMQLLSEFRIDLQIEEADVNLKEYLLRMEQILFIRP